MCSSDLPATNGGYEAARRKNSTPAGMRTAPRTPARDEARQESRPAPVVRGRLLTQHTGLPPRGTSAAKPARGKKGR